YKSTNGDYWKNNTGWDTTVVPVSHDEFNNWYGVRIDLFNNKITEFSLNLSNNNLNGVLPIELGLLSELNVFNIDENNLEEHIPSEIGNMTKLDTLWMNQNQFSGEIPPEIGNLINLKSLDLAINNLTGSIPVEIGNLTKMFELYLEGNNLNGEIPSEVANLPRLYKLWLQHNSLTGSVPSEIGDLQYLESLQLSYNNLTGKLPLSFTNLRLFTFSFNNNDGLCAPLDNAFQQWLNTIFLLDGPNCVTVDIEDQLELKKIQFYPNPVTDYITFTNLPYDSEIEVFDILGRKVLTSQDTHIDLADLSPGMYMYTVILDERRISGKLIKNK
ncbi:MAG: T9SS type A sorting domain-containing protein, partial [bacterium]|nr:T9SS type A sorting domain-containing protein [bacterium]